MSLLLLLASYLTIAIKLFLRLAECVHSRLRVDLDRQNAFIQSFHMRTCKKHAYYLVIDAKYGLLEQCA